MINHIALLVPSVDFAAGVLAGHGFPIGPAEVWDGEGTREIYVGTVGASQRLLLMEPTRPDSSYARALVKRGPGLHHIAIDVLDLTEFLKSVESSSWVLHPYSETSIPQVRTAYLMRKGMPMLIEVQEKPMIKNLPPFLTQLKILLPSEGPGLVRAVGLDTLVQYGSGLKISVHTTDIEFEALLPK